MSGRKFISDEQRDHVIMLADAGIGQQEIATIMGLGLTTVNNMINVAKAVKEEDWGKLSKLRDNVPSKVVFDWAFAKYQKEEPKKEVVVEQPKEEPNNDVLFANMIKTACAKAIEESCKCNIEQIDKDQMGRIMLAMGKITDALADISLKLEDFQKTQNANSDSIYALLTSMNNSIILELKKRK